MGDAVLQEISKRMATTLRPYDHIGRYGGEEFLIVLNATKDQAVDICERLRRAIADAAIAAEQTEL